VEEERAHPRGGRPVRPVGGVLRKAVPAGRGAGARGVRRDAAVR
jgi:hypothetical protein